MVRDDALRASPHHEADRSCGVWVPAFAGTTAMLGMAPSRPGMSEWSRKHQGPRDMKLYDSKAAPNPRRVRIYLAEKGIAVPTEQVDIMAKQHLKPDYADVNPL